jgi:acetylornithine/succinyldiaminopimelate/putrescine aminotransferase
VDAGWHGRTLTVLAATTDEKIVPGIRHALLPSTRIPLNDVGAVSQFGEDLAAVIVEPIMSIGGIAELSPEFLAAIRKRCDEIGAYLVYDEVQTGIGRLGRPFAAGEHGIVPDMVTCAKALGNGYPIGAVLATTKVADKTKLYDLGSTFGGGPMACAAAVAVLEAIENENLMDKAAAVGRRIHETCVTGPVKRIRGRGCLIGLELDRPGAPLQRELLERGFITGTSANPNVLRLMPPLNMPLHAVDELARALASVN